MTHPSRHFADDKDIFDLLTSQRRGFSDETLRRILRERGIIVSPDLERTQLVDYISRLPFGFRDLKVLLDQTGKQRRREPKTTCEGIGASIDGIEEAANFIRDTRTERRDEHYKIHRKRDGSLEISVTYATLDTSKNRLRQRTEEHLTIVIEPGQTDNTARMRFPDDERSREIAEAISLRALGDPKEITRETISLEGCTSEQRTRFFESLISNIAGFSLQTVTRVGFRRLDDSTPDGDLDGETEGNGNSTNLPGIEDEEPGARIIRVTLDGAGLFSSTEFNQLKTNGFYVNTAVWRSRMDGGEGLDAEFDAGFLVGDSGTAFTYRLRAVFRRNADGEPTNTRVRPTDDEKTKFLRALEDSATNAKDEAIKASGVEETPQELGDP